MLTHYLVFTHRSRAGRSVVRARVADRAMGDADGTVCAFGDARTVRRAATNARASNDDARSGGVLRCTRVLASHDSYRSPVDWTPRPRRARRAAIDRFIDFFTTLRRTRTVKTTTLEHTNDSSRDVVTLRARLLEISHARRRAPARSIRLNRPLAPPSTPHPRPRRLSNPPRGHPIPSTSSG